MSDPLFDYGDELKITATFTDEDGAAADPGTVTFKTKDPAGAVVSYVYGTDAEVVKVSAGVYKLVFTPSAEGDWYWRAEGTAPVQQAAEGKFKVANSVFY
ncbi:MAG: hypothetical protein H6661_04050 [Ardenticatenaceae bacterium]|nr:hypothetical protein [Ardenticatenaceae bacterium]